MTTSTLSGRSTGGDCAALATPLAWPGSVRRAPSFLRWGSSTRSRTQASVSAREVLTSFAFVPSLTQLAGRPRVADGFCPEAEGRWALRVDAGWLYMWVLYWTITTMTTIGYGDISPLVRVRDRARAAPFSPLTVRVCSARARARCVFGAPRVLGLRCLGMLLRFVREV